MYYKKTAYYLAIDQGTHATRSALFDANGDLVDIEWLDISLNRIDNVRVEQDAAEILLSVTSSLNTLLKRQPPDVIPSIASCGISTQRSSVVCCSKKGAAISPLLSWQDVRGQDYLLELSAHHHTIQSLTGLPVSAHYGASKLHWLLAQTQNQRPAPLMSYLLTNLLKDNHFVVDHSNAQRTQLMSLSTLNWSSQLCHWFDIPENSLPTCQPMVTNYGEMRDTNIPVSAVCGDQNAAVFGTGIFPETDTAIINLGSGAFILRMLEEHTPGKQLLTGIAYSDKRQTRYLREGTVNGAGTALDWLIETYAIEHVFENLPDWLEKKHAPPVFLNTVGNLGSPWWQQNIQPTFVHADLDDKPALAVAVVESILFLLMDNFSILNAESPLTNIRVSGGLSRLDGLCQKMANLMQVPVHRFDTPEATARGSAWLAAGMPDHWKLTPQITFSPESDTQLAARYALFCKALRQRLNSAALPAIPKLVAHRGYMNQYPENTLAGLEAALKIGAAYVEFDIQLNKDNEFIVIHDATLQRTAGVEGSVFDLQTAELKKISAHQPDKFGSRFQPEYIATLADVLSLLGDYPESKAMVEIKEESLERWGHKHTMERLLPILNKHSEQCIVISFNPKAIEYTHQHSAIKTGWVLHQYDEKHRRMAMRVNPDYLICNHLKLPDSETPWPGQWQWMFYDIGDPQTAINLAARGASLIETAEIAGMQSYFQKEIWKK